MQKKTDFELVGHDCPLGHYPAPLVPIGYRNGEYVAVYLDYDKSEPYCEQIPNDAEFVHHSDTLKESLQAFDYRKDKLFGLSDRDVVFYAAVDKKKFFLKLLKDESFSEKNVFFRLSLAKATENTSQIEYELRRCIQYLKLDDAEFIPSWYQTQQDQLSSLWRKKFGREFPDIQQFHQVNTMLKHACFLSYRGLENEVYKAIVEQINRKLTDELNFVLELKEPVYLDKRRFQPGYSLDNNVATALCESVCMVVFYTPRYFKSAYCAMEYKAMKKLEQERVAAFVIVQGKQNPRLIIPLIFRGSKNLPDEIRNNQKCFYMDNLSTREVEHSIIVKLAEYISECYEAFNKLSVNKSFESSLEKSFSCENFDLPSLQKQDINSYQDQSSPPSFPV